jgi:bisphosphoglycerate-independent phosphoglycerate mutase (AlkP superfamily)
MLGFRDAPLMDAPHAGQKLASLANTYDFSLFEYWASDYAGHKQQMDRAVHLMETFDAVLGGLVEAWEDGLILVTSDHGNMEDLSTRKHTDAHVPALLIGDKAIREEFMHGLNDLTDIAPAIWKTVMNES